MLSFKVPVAINPATGLHENFCHSLVDAPLKTFALFYLSSMHLPKGHRRSIILHEIDIPSAVLIAESSPSNALKRW